jgi:cyclase
MPNPTRREFLVETASCARHLALAAAFTPALARAAWARRTVGPVVAAEPFGRLEAIGANVWALISTPLGGDFTTVSNGGIIAGKDGVLVYEGLTRPAGAKWLAERAKDLTGKWPTHALVSHYHGDHVNGIAGYGDGGPMPKLHLTANTRERSDKNQPADEARSRALGSAIMLDPTSETKLDLGGRTVRVIPHAGHTASDVVVLLDDPPILFGGDLIWNGMFPNYMECVPTLLAKTVRGLRDRPGREEQGAHGGGGRGGLQAAGHARRVDTVRSQVHGDGVCGMVQGAWRMTGMTGTTGRTPKTFRTWRRFRRARTRKATGCLLPMAL